MAIFGTFIALSENKVLSAGDAFVILTVFNVIHVPLTLLPTTISHIIMVKLLAKLLTVGLNILLQYMF